MNKGLVSVIVPVYKVKETYLRRCIESIQNQTYKQLEIILIDDGSPDNSGNICEEYALKDTRIIVKHIKNGGVSNARNIGVNIARGDFVMFVDSDDILVYILIEYLVKILLENKADCSLVSCKTIKVSEVTDSLEEYSLSNTQTKVLDKEEIIDTLLYMKKPFPNLEITAVWGTLYKKNILKDCYFEKEMTIAEDFVFKFNVFKKVKNVVVSNMEGYNYLIHKNSAMRNGFNIKKINTIDILEKLIEKEKKSIYYDGVLSRCINIGFVVLLMIPIDKKYKKERLKVEKFIKKYRKEVFKNSKTRLKVKLAILCSYIGFDNMQRIFKIVQK